MQRVKDFIMSTIGKKELMALSGLAFIAYLVIHLFGNFFIYGGAEAFNNYAEKLHSLGPIVSIFNVGLLTIGALHIVSAIAIIIRNLGARPQRYAVKRSEGGSTLSSQTMAVTGPLILIFVVFHLLHFTLVDKSETTIAALVDARFHDPLWVGIYAAAMVMVGLHISHGLWSGFQTIGVETEKRGELRSLSLLASLIFGLGFGSMPIAVYFVKGVLN